MDPAIFILNMESSYLIFVAAATGGELSLSHVVLCVYVCFFMFPMLSRVFTWFLLFFMFWLVLSSCIMFSHGFSYVLMFFLMCSPAFSCFTSLNWSRILKTGPLSYLLHDQIAPTKTTCLAILLVTGDLFGMVI